MKRITLLVVMAAAACSPPAGRDVAWFDAHPGEARKVLVACRSGHPNSECQQARIALNRLESRARANRYRQGFK